MRTYFVYIRKINKVQYRVHATQFWNNIEGEDRTNIPAIWKVPECYGSEDAKAKVLLYQAMSINRVDTNVVRIR